VAASLGTEAGGVPGAGAAGGAAYGLKCFLGAGFINGTEHILRLSGFVSYLRDQKTTCVFTGEGRIDAQTLRGKLIHGVVRESAPLGIPVVAVCGKSDIPEKTGRDMGLYRVLEVSDPDKPLSYNMEHAHALIARSVERFLREEAME
jgi:glycerate kinase